ncbi:PDDEXK nuclease domain-containing protein [Actinobacillus pleuropneumoniae]|uniref:PDDEXK nuclease domain-containing protein n=1 Tax=Actinobacillus pleuropneumoniae TaxID=715 RepID=A0A9Q4HAA5_ACTPL|nr:PDDEXK nuclease domain-containing protein [Actinobacillus pleuropneumoniae]MCY6368967.1 PDDEXK nuclease domain-containing protein [Actinobacillus pleuropneumoniae]MCY6385841.1 PDDEXK nuclease domain-containing protein [Actinobacillus pleuropneumoniae]MCY6396543.1 PDDEXK nuclease domain-containing protein [Actinobacillus pleuropneumoniae]MCY6398761.1 PDDEXK nuclease domain-containing protein [Actinobacillus pleuropneumoniae]MCY6410343.1 PDDEXK nuclease domain-containing protein [Actinobacill
MLQARETAIRAVDFQRVLMYWHIGKRIFEEEQQGQDRADYGAYLIKSLAQQLQPEFGSGFSARQLERQIYSNLYERLLLSNDKASVLAVARNETVPTDPRQIIKDPMALEFLGLRRESAYYEKDLEQAIITYLQDFLLELGNGFSFVARQKRLHLDGDEFFADLVFYNRLLQCFVVIEIKTHKLTHQDLGQLQMYVNYFDRVEKLPHENPTIGILLCADKNDAVVKFSLPENQKQIFASQYQLYLPTEKMLLDEMQKEIESFEQKVEEKRAVYLAQNKS